MRADAGRDEVRIRDTNTDMEAEIRIKWDTFTTENLTRMEENKANMSVFFS